MPFFVEGQLIAEEYQVLGLLGQGGMALVYRCLDLNLGREVVVKLLNDQLLAIDDARDRFLQEARTQARLRHPGIMPVERVLQTSELVAMVMPWHPGRSLADLLESSPGKVAWLSEGEALELFVQLVAAVRAAHEADPPVVHRDIKPDNVYLAAQPDGSRRVLLMDFGIAKVWGDQGMRTQTGSRMGTVAYMAPEQIRGAKDVTFAADIWALGVVLYEMVCGRRPFTAENDLLLPGVVLAAQVPREPLQRLSMPLRQLILRCLQPDPARRFPATRDMEQAVEQLRNPQSQPSGSVHSVTPGRAGPAGPTAPGWPAPAAGRVNGPASGSVAGPTAPVWPAPAGRLNDPGSGFLAGPVASVRPVAAAAGPAASLQRVQGGGRRVLFGLLALLLAGGLGWYLMQRVLIDSPGDLELGWVLVPGGTYSMGSDQKNEDQQPAHEVTLADFEMMRTEVTVAMYRACMDAGACSESHDLKGTCKAWRKLSDKPTPVERFQVPAQPVVCVTWQQARDFARWIGAGARLCSEAEWEYAARSGGRNITYPWGNALPSMKVTVWSGSEPGAPGPVCSTPGGSNAQGICDLGGNAAEWTADEYEDSYRGAPGDGRARTSWFFEGSKVVRGGSWMSDSMNFLACTHRQEVSPGNFTCGIGFRLCR